MLTDAEVGGAPDCAAWGPEGPVGGAVGIKGDGGIPGEAVPGTGGT